MTVETTDITSGPYAGNDIAVEFDHASRIDDKTQLIVYETDDADVQTILTVDTDYTVASLGDDDGVQVTRTAGALPTGYTWYIRSDYKLTQATAFTSLGRFLPAIHEAAMDKLTILMQQVLDLIGRGPRLPDSYTGDLPLTMEEPESGRYLTWNLTLDGIINADAPSVVIPQESEATVAAMVANLELVAGDTVFTQGHYAAGDGGHAPYLLSVVDAGAGILLNNGLYANIQTLGYIDALQFGVKVNDYTFDSTSALEAADAAAVALSTSASPLRVEIPAGYIYAANVEKNSQTLWRGSEVGQTRLLYNGTDASSGDHSAVLKIHMGGSGAVPWGGVQNMTIRGHSSDINTACEHGIYYYDGGMDWGLKTNNIQIGQTLSDGIFMNGSVVNIYFGRVRFDSVGGYPIRIAGGVGQEKRPVKVDNFTYDNNITGSFAIKAAALGYYANGQWGKGFIAIDEAAGVVVTLDTCRVEINKDLIPDTTDGKVNMIRMDSAGGNVMGVTLANWNSFFRSTQPGIFIEATGTHIKVTAVNIDPGTVLMSMLRWQGTSIMASMTSNFTYTSNTQQDDGVAMQGVGIGFRTATPSSDGTVFKPIRRNHIVFRSTVAATAIGNMNLGWVNMAEGWTRAAGGTLSNTASTTNTSTTVPVGSNVRMFILDQNINLVGAIQDFDALVTDIDLDAEEITIDTPATVTEAVTITWNVPSWEAWGIIGGVQAVAVSALAGDTNAANMSAKIDAVISSLKTSVLMRS